MSLVFLKQIKINKIQLKKKKDINLKLNINIKKKFNK